LITLIEQKTERNTKSIQIDLEKDSVLIYHSYLSMLKEKSIASSDSLINEWNYSKNNKLNPQYIPINSGKKVWWRCSLGHEWQAVVASRNRGSGCPFCSHNRVLSGYNDLATLKPDLASEWHPTKNGDLLPDNILSSTAKKVWWRCHLGHDWQASPNDRARGNGCPYCSNQRVAVGENDLCTENPYLVAEWHPTKNGNLVPSMFVSGSRKKVWWMCKEGHEWQANIYHRNNGSGCPICHFKKLSKHNSKGINVYNASDLSLYGTFDCARTLCEHFGIEYSKQMGNIASVCRRQQKTLMRKYILRYVDDDELRKE